MILNYVILIDEDIQVMVPKKEDIRPTSINMLEISAYAYKDIKIQRHKGTYKYSYRIQYHII